MAAEYSIITAQTVQPNRALLFPVASYPCTSGYIFHKNGSGIFRAANRVRYLGNCRRPVYETLYNVSFHGNIAIPEGGTAGEISLAIVVDGEVDPESVMTVTPAAVGDLWNVGTSILIAVPSICGCSSVSVENISTQAVEIANGVIGFDAGGIRRVSC